MTGVVVAVNLSSSHSFSKTSQKSIKLIAGIGVEGDAHAGETVQHRSRVVKDPTQPNLRQVHLVHVELHEELKAKGFNISPGDMGENITTRDVDLLKLPSDTKLHLGDEAVIQITGLRNPCVQLDRFQLGLMAALLDKDKEGNIVRKAGVMSVVVSGGIVRVGDPIRIELPSPPHRSLERV